MGGDYAYHHSLSASTEMFGRNGEGERVMGEERKNDFKEKKKGKKKKKTGEDDRS